MMVTFVSQCEKKSLKRTRRVLDAFADRIGDNTWQTVITKEGLQAVRKLLRKTASKNTAVSCHWIRSRSRTELVWVVGQKHKFNVQGMVPVNRTDNDLLKADWENGWSQAYSIQILAVLAALLHDLGKATEGFQEKLLDSSLSRLADPYRHEWISLHLFLALIRGCTTDEEWLDRFCNLSEYLKNNPGWLAGFGEYPEKVELNSLPSLAKAIIWLIVTHHRMPFHDEAYNTAQGRADLRKDDLYFDFHMDDFFKWMKPVDYWVRNPASLQNRKDNDRFWRLKDQLQNSQSWQKHLSRWAKKAINHVPLMQLAETTISDPFILLLSRLCLMVGDHNYSSLTLDDSNKVVKGDADMRQRLIANTDRKTRHPRQALDQHLLGVSVCTSRFARLLPGITRNLPSLDRDKAKLFTTRTSAPGFLWQNQSFDLAKSLQSETDSSGFFGVNMASTGKGKTLGNARIMAGLVNPERGVRFTVALGLRVLTLQTGRALGARLGLDESDLAVLVGSTASRRLFELDTAGSEEVQDAESSGSESLEEIVEEVLHDSGQGFGESDLGTVIENPKARELLFAPIVSCTIDHLVGASETTRGGRYMAPMLRLLSSDLILDEPDDFNQSDLPALARLVHLVGLFGGRLLLSSATLTPDLTTGLFVAYQAGRALWNQHTGTKASPVVCAWFDEHRQEHNLCVNREAFMLAHERYAQGRATRLQKEGVRRSAEILETIPMAKLEGRSHDYSSLAETLIGAASELHHRHHEQRKGKTASIGLIRIANIRELVAVAQAMFISEMPQDTQIHLCCYHARQLLVLRNALENRLDRLLNRTKTASIFDHSEIEQAVTDSEYSHHIFIVLATAVAEVGRDHDYDWAIVEPSSMRSIIQLAGRVWRHRPEKRADNANIKILGTNIKALKNGAGLGVGEAVFEYPGFENKNDGFLLDSHSSGELITADQMKSIDSIPRIVRPDPLRPRDRLADLEHQVMQQLMNANELNHVNAFWKEGTANRACVHLQRISPFRESRGIQTDYVCLPDRRRAEGFSFYTEEKVWQEGEGAATVNTLFNFTELGNYGQIKPWLSFDLASALEELAQRLGEEDLRSVALRFSTVTLEELKDNRGSGNSWNFHPWLGFWSRD
jgi:CRISPR-associated endonuclease/helicase Cas3